MIKCKNCGGLCDYKGESHCPSCNVEYTVTALEASDMMKEANRIIDESVGIEERVPLGKRIVTFLLGKGVPAVIGLAVGLLLGLIF